MLEEPDERIVHVRICGGAEWVTTDSTRKNTKGWFATVVQRNRDWRTWGILVLLV